MRRRKHSQVPFKSPTFLMTARVTASSALGLVDHCNLTTSSVRARNHAHAHLGPSLRKSSKSCSQHLTKACQIQALHAPQPWNPLPTWASKWRRWPAGQVPIYRLFSIGRSSQEACARIEGSMKVLVYALAALRNQKARGKALELGKALGAPQAAW